MDRTHERPFDHHVAIFARPADPSALRTLLQEKLGLNSVDAGIAVARVPGPLPQHFTRGQAEHIADEVRQLGVRAAAIADVEIPDLRHAETSHHVRCMPQGLELCNVQGAVDRVWPWEQLQLLSLGRVAVERTHRYLADENSPRSQLATAPSSVTPSQSLYGQDTWTIWRDPLRVLHFDSEHLNYEFLGDELESSGEANYRKLIAALLSYSPHVVQPAATRAYLQDGSDHHAFDDAEELRAYTLNEYLLARHLGLVRLP
ncbi:MAG: hypothetical protein R3B90_04555 [Planctomycetaceae bacterium]